jgi:hypothetical protein
MTSVTAQDSGTFTNNNWHTINVNNTYSFSNPIYNSESNPIIYNYDLHMINKYDENLNSSLSFISDFDLEEDEENQIDESFNSCENEDSEIEQIEIKNSSKQAFRDNIDEENDVKLEKDWNDIQNFLLNKLTK